MAAAAAIITLNLIPQKPSTITCPPKTRPTHFRSLSSPLIVTSATPQNRDTTREPAVSSCVAGLVGAAGLGLGLAVTAVVQPSSAAAAALPLLMGQQLSEPANALSVPTWAVHVSSVVEWITAMALVWQYGEKSGFESWKGLSWGMVPLLGGAFCACTWHFFYNSESLEILVALQAALTVIGNATMCIAAFRIFKSSEERRKNL